VRGSQVDDAVRALHEAFDPPMVQAEVGA
jgi:hypothetical protein